MSIRLTVDGTVVLGVSSSPSLAPLLSGVVKARGTNSNGVAETQRLSSGAGPSFALLDGLLAPPVRASLDIVDAMSAISKDEADEAREPTLSPSFFGELFPVVTGVGVWLLPLLGGVKEVG